MNNLQMRFFKVMVDDRLEALMADADEAAKLAKRLGGSVARLRRLSTKRLRKFLIVGHK